MDKRLLLTVISDQKSLGWHDSFIERDIPASFLTGDEIVVISGIRRCGKSTILHQIRKGMDEKDFYLNFDDDRLIQFGVGDFQVMLELFIELFGNQKTFYFDEIQNVSGWEQFVRRLHDYGHKIFITGSNASMLSRELGTHLTGRYLSFELYPFSFKEYLKLNKEETGNPDLFSTEKRASMKRCFNAYFVDGGFPVFIRNKNPEYLKALYESVLYRDIMVRNNLANEKEILEMVFYLASNVAKLTSYNALSKVIGVANSTTVKNYFSFFMNSYLLFVTNKYDYSLKKQVLNPKKVYLIDNALVKMLGFYFTDDHGRLLENLVFVELLRRGKEIYYHKANKECDFVLRDRAKITEAIQVSWSLDDPKTRKRETDGLLDAMTAYQLHEGLILTASDEEEFLIDDKKVNVLPAWKWLLR